MDLSDPKYILIRDFGRNLVTHRDFGLGALVDDPERLESWVTTPHEALLRTRRGPSPKIYLGAPVTDSRLKLEAHYIKQDPKHAAQYTIEGLRETLTSSCFQTKQLHIPYNWVSDIRPRTFLEKLGENTAARMLFNGRSPSLPIYMVTGIRYARGLEYSVDQDEERWIKSRPVPNRKRDTFMMRTKFQVLSGSIRNKDVVIAYRIHKITRDERSGNLRFDVHVDRTRAVQRRSQKHTGWVEGSGVWHVSICLLVEPAEFRIHIKAHFFAPDADPEILSILYGSVIAVDPIALEGDWVTHRSGGTATGQWKQQLGTAEARKRSNGFQVVEWQLLVVSIPSNVNCYVFKMGEVFGKLGEFKGRYV
ncbi:unnamed protein product [Clonostachys rosea]|uniref:Uncharacterized protein n=1 Tax=Bionectria ochroleuca TaxID=29856 RepID=A0ABY6U938_BIOOC|nr:unnamed protein product [Clonostachys rosea]